MRLRRKVRLSQWSEVKLFPSFDSRSEANGAEFDYIGTCLPSSAQVGPMMNFKAAFLFIPPLAIAMAGCSSLPLKDAGTLSTYRNLGPAKGNASKSRTFVDKNGLINIPRRLTPKRPSLSDVRNRDCNRDGRRVCLGLQVQHGSCQLIER